MKTTITVSEAIRNIASALYQCGSDEVAGVYSDVWNHLEFKGADIDYVLDRLEEADRKVDECAAALGKATNSVDADVWRKFMRKAEDVASALRHIERMLSEDEE